MCFQNGWVQVVHWKPSGKEPADGFHKLGAEPHNVCQVSTDSMCNLIYFIIITWAIANIANWTLH